MKVADVVVSKNLTRLVAAAKRFAFAHQALREVQARDDYRAFIGTAEHAAILKERNNAEFELRSAATRYGFVPKKRGAKNEELRSSQQTDATA